MKCYTIMTETGLTGNLVERYQSRVPVDRGLKYATKFFDNVAAEEAKPGVTFLLVEFETIKTSR